jgi:hypothetical protein
MSDTVETLLRELIVETRGVRDAVVGLSKELKGLAAASGRDVGRAHQRIDGIEHKVNGIIGTGKRRPAAVR